MEIELIRQRLRALGAKPEHEQRVLRDWLQGRAYDQGRRRPRDYLPLAMREALPVLDAELRGMASLLASHPTEDGSARLLVGLADGQMVESVLLPRDGLCISSQVGCAVGCQFCMTGRSGLIRQLTSGEMLAQVALARQQRAV
jgi:23S rRNA (adenine2503-C2)-methyltransferase